VLGSLFGILTVFQLLELANPSQPLLRRLLVETPGTYHHSLMVGNLAERAAEAIGADPLLTRVAAYYHDIGKLANPLAFIENQTGTNPHDDLDPAVSASIVSAHVRDGLALADRYRLPPQIREIIPGHHGTSLIRYFHTLAQQRGAVVDEAAFRHPGPKPRSKEAGINLMGMGHHVVDCVATGNGGDGVHLYGMHLEVRGCSATHNSGNGIGGMGMDWAMSGNSADDNDKNGIVVGGMHVTDQGGNRGSGNRGLNQRRPVSQCEISERPCLP